MDIGSGHCKVEAGMLTCTVVVGIKHGKHCANAKDIIILMEIHL